MKESGVVVKIEGKFASVRIGRTSACGSCGKCGMTDSQKHVDFFVENTLGVSVGDTVVVNIPDNNTVGLALVAYAIPLVPALLAMFLSIRARLADWISVLAFFGGFAIGMLVVGLIDKAKRHRWGKLPTLESVIGGSNEQSSNN